MIRPPKKSLGQNFLLDQNIARKIVESLALTSDDRVLEIGPGYGSLTRWLLKQQISLTAVELDKILVSQLEHEFSGNKNFTLVHADFIKVDLNELISDKVRVVGNIPYHITSPVIFKILDNCDIIQDMTLMVQREVAERVIAQPNTKAYGILSINSQAFADPRILFRVPKTVFKPRPKVDSAVVRWVLNPIRKEKIKDYQFFQRLVKTAFNQRRKMLRNAMSEFIENLDPDKLDLDLQKRPENLSVGEWVDLSNRLTELQKR